MSGNAKQEGKGPEITFEQTGLERYVAYIPVRKPRKGESARVRHVGTIERRGGRWLWWMKDDSDAGFTKTLKAAKDAIRRCA